MPEVLSTSPRFSSEALKAAIARELEAAPDDALEARVLFEDGTVRSTVALRLSRDRWVLGFGGFLEVPPQEAPRWGAFGHVTVTF